ncbi:hypothetical protein K2X85_06285 [bacterium]|nr:hypothetical protein [bacterium]
MRWIHFYPSVFVLMLAARTEAHPFAVTLAEVEFNRETESFEVALRIHPESLGRALQEHRREYYLDADPPRSRQELLIRYFESHFRLTAASAKDDDRKRTPTYRWVGEQEERGWCWVFFEIPWRQSTDRLYVRSSVLCDVYPEQINTVLFHRDDGSATCTLRQTQLESVVRWRAEDPRAARKQPQLRF